MFVVVTMDIMYFLLYFVIYPFALFHIKDISYRSGSFFSMLLYLDRDTQRAYVEGKRICLLGMLPDVTILICLMMKLVWLVW